MIFDRQNPFIILFGPSTPQKPSQSTGRQIAKLEVGVRVGCEPGVRERIGDRYQKAQPG